MTECSNFEYDAIGQACVNCRALLNDHVIPRSFKVASIDRDVRVIMEHEEDN